MPVDPRFLDLETCQFLEESEELLYRLGYRDDDELHSAGVLKTRRIHTATSERMTVDRGVYTQRLIRAGKPVTGSRMLHGIASTPAISTHGQSLDPLGCICTLPVPLVVSHAKQGDPVGEVTLLRRSVGKVYIQARVFDDHAGRYVWDMIEDGELRGLSVGPTSAELRAEVDDVRFFRRWGLRELSLCRRGANPDCVFEILEGARS